MSQLREGLRAGENSPERRDSPDKAQWVCTEECPRPLTPEVRRISSGCDSRLLIIEEGVAGHGPLHAVKGQAEWERAGETAAAVGTGYIYITKCLEFDGRPIFFIAACSLFWGTWLVWQYSRHGQWVMKSWGLSCSWLHLRHSFVWPSIFSALSLLSLVAVCRFIGQPPMFDNWHMWLAVAVYPLYGVVQHFVLQSLLTRNLSYLITGSDERTLWTEAVEAPSMRTWSLLALCSLASALAFAYIHSPQKWLMRATGALGIPFALFYLRDRCLWPLGLYHGLLGCAFYYWFLQGDPLAHVIGPAH